MKKSLLLIALIVLAVAGNPLQGQTGAAGAMNPEIQNREKLLLQGLAPAQLQMLQQTKAMFETMPMGGVEPQAAFAQVFNRANSAGLDENSAAFLVMVAAANDMDKDLQQIMNESNLMSMNKQRLQEQLAALNSSLGAAAPAAGRGIRPAAGAIPLPAALKTACFQIAYSQAPPLEIKNWQGMSREQKIAEAGIMGARLEMLEGLLVQMAEQVRLAMEKRQQFCASAEQIMVKIPHDRQKEQR